MTNAQKYLKDENYKKTLWYDFKNWCNDTKINCPYGIAFEEFMDSPVKLTLTEDERVILRNIDIKNWNTILREDNGEIAFGYKLSRGYRSLGKCVWFNHLFQFIKERRRIRDKGATK